MISVTDANGTAITDPTHIANVNPIRYRGYYYDAETGLYYLQSRYYNPQWGRFLNADDMSVLFEDQDNLIETNLFAYCDNEPVNHKDPTGYRKIAVKTWIVASMLDAILFMTTYGLSVSFTSLGLALKSLVIGKKSRAAINKLLFGKIIPVIVRGNINRFLTATRKVIWRLTGITLSWLNIRVVDHLLGKLRYRNLGNIIGMFMSCGSFLQVC